MYIYNSVRRALYLSQARAEAFASFWQIGNTIFANTLIRQQFHDSLRVSWERSQQQQQQFILTGSEKGCIRSDHCCQKISALKMGKMFQGNWMFHCTQEIKHLNKRNLLNFGQHGNRTPDASAASDHFILNVIASRTIPKNCERKFFGQNIFWWRQTNAKVF